MPDIQILPVAVETRWLATTPADWDAAQPALLESMLVQQHIVRAFEETVLELAAEGLVHGPAHSSIGQEGGAVGSALALRPDDEINGSHRGHHQFLAKALGYVAPQGLRVGEPLAQPVLEMLQRTLAEILGLDQGYCHGRGGSMHLRWREAGALGTNAIVGGGVPLAAGAAWAHRHGGTDRVAVSYIGDGAVNIGSVLETMNLAAAWKLPLCFFIENNLYAVATTVAESTAEPRLALRGVGFGIASWRVDGMDPLAVYLAQQAALEHMRQGHGPTIIEAEVYRYFHQNGSFPGSAFGYRTKEEEAHWRARDPLDRVAHEMRERGLVSEVQVQALRAQIVQAMARIVEELCELVEGKRRVRAALWPSPAFCNVGLRGEAPLLGEQECDEEATTERPLRKAKFIDVVAEVLTRRMDTDPGIVVMGEDIHRLKGGTNGATRGLHQRFPERVLGTPICENAFVGLAGGIAMDGRFRPVVEFMFPDFMWVAADQVFNQIGKARHMFGGDQDVPLVLRTKVAIGNGYGSQHSMDPAGVFATSPGWRIVAPSTPFDYIGLMNTALRASDPVLVLEHTDLYATSGAVPEGEMDHCIPFGKAAIRREGRAMTVISYLSMPRLILEKVAQMGIDAEVIDLRTLDRASLDWATIEASLQKTNNVLLVEQGAMGTAYGHWLADEIQRRCFDWLDQPVERVLGSEASPSISRVLERAAYAGAEEIEAGLRRVLAAQGVRS